jgi:hypothetical protein
VGAWCAFLPPSATRAPSKRLNIADGAAEARALIKIKDQAATVLYDPGNTHTLDSQMSFSDVAVIAMIFAGIAAFGASLRWPRRPRGPTRR